MSDIEKTKTRNVLVLGVSLGLILTGVMTISATAETILRSYEARTGTNGLNAFLRKVAKFLKCEIRARFKSLGRIFSWLSYRKKIIKLSNLKAKG